MVKLILISEILLLVVLVANGVISQDNDVCISECRRSCEVNAISRTPAKAPCTKTVGMKNGTIEDGAISAISSHSKQYQQIYGRLDLHNKLGVHYGAWIPAKPWRSGQWIQVDLKRATTITGILTQGRPWVSRGVSSFKIAYGPSVDPLQVIQNNNRDVVFEATPNHDVKTRNKFNPPVTGRYFRLIIQDWERYPALRFDLLIC